MYLLPLPSPLIISQQEQEEEMCAFFCEKSLPDTLANAVFIIMPPLSPQASVKAFILIPFIFCRFKMCIQISGWKKLNVRGATGSKIMSSA